MRFIFTELFDSAETESIFQSFDREKTKQYHLHEMQMMGGGAPTVQWCVGSGKPNHKLLSPLYPISL